MDRYRHRQKKRKVSYSPPIDHDRSRLRDELDLLESEEAELDLYEYIEYLHELGEIFDIDELVELDARDIHYYEDEGVIDYPTVIGKHAIYGYRQVLQALLLGRMLSIDIPASEIARLLEGMDERICRRLLLRDSRKFEEYFQGPPKSRRPGPREFVVERIADEEPGDDDDRYLSVTSPQTLPWIRIPVNDGLEIHLDFNYDIPEDPAEFRELMRSIRRTLRSVRDD